MLGKHLFELNLIGYVFYPLFLNGIFWEGIPKWFGFREGKSSEKARIYQSYVQSEMMATPSRTEPLQLRVAVPQEKATAPNTSFWILRAKFCPAASSQ